MSEGEYRERHNPFPGLDLNDGNKRERCEGLMHFAELPKWKGGSVLEGGPGERMRIEEGFARFSLWRYVIPLLPQLAPVYVEIGRNILLICLLGN
jgi:hypothetical protein